MDSDKYGRIIAALERLTPEQLAQLGAWLDALPTLPELLELQESEQKPAVPAGKYTLVGYDTFDNEFYDLAEFETEQEAIAAARLRLVELEKTQPECVERRARHGWDTRPDLHS